MEILLGSYLKQKQNIGDSIVLRSTYFQYNGTIYEQKDGAAMGRPVSAVFG